MFHVKWCMLYVVGFLFTSRTVTNGSISSALMDNANASLPANNTDNEYNNTQPALRSFTEDGDDWELTKFKMMTSAISLLSNYSTIEDILRLGLRGPDGKPLTARDLSAVFDVKTGKLLIHGYEHVARPRMCEVREGSIDVDVPEMTADTFAFPRSIKVSRCSGGCHLDNIGCVPVRTRKVIYNLLQLTVDRGHPTPRVIGLYPMDVVEHTTCSCSCLLTPASCGLLQYHDPIMCRCHCKSYVRCYPPHNYSPETCKCECPHKMSCCPTSDTHCGLSFNEHICECEQDNTTMLVTSATKEDILQAEDTDEASKS